MLAKNDNPPFLVTRRSNPPCLFFLFVWNKFADFIECASATEGYRASVDEAIRIADYQKQRVDPMYHNKIDGLCGNDDCGQMSAWYIFSAMGFYPVCPGSDQYVLGTPYFPKMTLRLPGGNELTIIARGVDKKNAYYKSVTLNGKEVIGPFISHKDIVEGGVMVFSSQ